MRTIDGCGRGAARKEPHREHDDPGVPARGILAVELEVSAEEIVKVDDDRGHAIPTVRYIDDESGRRPRLPRRGDRSCDERDSERTHRNRPDYPPHRVGPRPRGGLYRSRKVPATTGATVEAG